MQNKANQLMSLMNSNVRTVSELLLLAVAGSPDSLLVHVPGVAGDLHWCAQIN